MLSRSLISIAALFACAGCVAEATPDASVIDGGAGSEIDSGVRITCPGARPAFEACVSGATWADCGGSGDAPVFACARGGPSRLPACRWFLRGCVPEDWTASPCTADALCCMDGYPFAGESPGSAWFAPALWLHEWGSELWDRERGRDVDVVVAPLDATDPSVRCTGAIEEYRGPCTTNEYATRVTSHGEVFVLSQASSAHGVLFWELVIEVTRDADASLHARVCRVQTTDYASGYCASGPDSPDCAASGTLTLDAFPTNDDEAALTRLHLEAVFADGSTMDLRL